MEKRIEEIINANCEDLEALLEQVQMDTTWPDEAEVQDELDLKELLLT